MITYYVGSGGHYSDWGDAYNSCCAMGALSDDYTFLQISDIVNLTASPGSINLNGHTVRFVCENQHGGNPNAGYKTSISSSMRFRKTTNLLGKIIVDGLNISNSAAATTALQMDSYNLGVNENLGINIIQNTLVKGSQIAGDRGVVIGNASKHAVQVKNVKIWNCDFAGLDLNYSSYTGIFSLVRFIENVVVYNCAKSGSSAIFAYVPHIGLSPLELSFKNVVACNNNNVLFGPCWNLDLQYICAPWLTNLIVLDNCADSDNTCFWTAADCHGQPTYDYGNNVLHNIVPATEFESLDDTNPDFLSLKKGALAVSADPTPDKGKAPLRVRFNSDIDYLWPAGMQLYNGGAVPSLSVNDIAGVQYGKYGDYPIGCHNAEVAY